MTVKELIEELEKMPGAMTVVCNFPGGTIDDMCDIDHVGKGKVRWTESDAPPKEEDVVVIY